MKILLVNKLPPYYRTGAERVLWTIAKELAARGHEITIFCPSPDRKEPEYHDNISFRYVHTRGTLDQKMIRFFLKGPFYYPSVYSEINPDIVYDNPSPFPFHMAHFYGNSLTVTKIHAIYGRLAFACKDNPVVQVGTYLGDHSYRLFTSEIMIANSESTAQRAKRVVPESNTVITNPIGIDSKKYQFSPMPNGNQVLSLSELRSRKSIETLLYAWNEVEAQKDDVRLVIAGDGPKRKSLEQTAENLQLQNIKFLGRVGEEEKKDLYAKSTLYVLPTLYEGFGLTNLEAMASGCAVISTDTWGVRDYLQDGENGRLVPIKNPPALSEAILSLLGDEKTISKLTTSARATAEEYSMKDSVAREVGILEQIP